MSGDAPESGEGHAPTGPPSAAKAPDAPIDAFVSYASHDASVANSIVETLEKRGLRCWIAPRNVPPGSHYADHIMSAISGAKVLVLVLSGSALASKHVGKEVERASAKGRPIIALRTDAAPLTPGFEYFLGESQWIDAAAGGFAAVAATLVEAVRSHADAALATGKVAAPMAASHSEAPPLRRRVISAAAVVVAVLLGYFVVDKFWLSKRAVGERPVAAVTPAAGPAAPAISEKSIAVLPFIDLSEKHDQEYFSDGLTEELIDRLVGAPGLKVIARTSSFQFKGKNEDVRSIARKLDVANLLEGSVRRSGQSLRVTAQLIRAVDGTHLWSHSYDEHVSDIFKVQEAIAEKVARELESALTTGSAAATGSTNLQAYDAVQKGRYLWHRSEVGDEDKALALFQEATRLDPGYALAWQRVASMYFWKGYKGELAVADARRQALSAVQRALAIDPNLAAAHAILGSIYRDFDWKWRAAKEELETAARLDPNGGYEADAGYLNWMLTGDISSEITSLRQDLVRDPLNTGTLWSLGISYWTAQRYAESADTYVRLLELNPRYSGVPSLYAQALFFMGQYEKALATALSDPDKSSQWGILPCIYWKLGRQAESDTALRELEKDAAKRAYDVAEMHACRGETEQVFVWLERAYRERQAGLPNLKFDPYLLRLHEDRRFQSLLVKMNLADGDDRH